MIHKRIDSHVRQLEKEERKFERIYENGVAIRQWLEIMNETIHSFSSFE